MADNLTHETRTLKNNNVKNFVLRIDLMPDNGIDFQIIINKIASFFDRTEKRIVEGVMIDISSSQPEMKKTQDFEYVLISDSKNITMTFSKPQSAFWFETTSYMNNEVYKTIFDEISKIFSEVAVNCVSKRIGMRFINEFKCSNAKEIKKILKKENAEIVNGLISDENISRALAYQEYNENGEKTRLQYGIVNKFYPSVISTYDLIIDIDSYFDIQIPISDWNAKISELNHTDYKYFLKLLSEQFIERLR